MMNVYIFSFALSSNIVSLPPFLYTPIERAATGGKTHVLTVIIAAKTPIHTGTRGFSLSLFLYDVEKTLNDNNSYFKHTLLT